MRSTIVIFFFLLLGIPRVADSQEPQKPEYKPDASFVRQYAETNGFLRGRPSKFQFTDDTKFVLFLRSSATEAPLILHSLELATGKIEELLNARQLIGDSAENLTAEEKARRERLRLTAKGIADFFQIPESTKLLIPLSGKLFTFDRVSREIKLLKTGPNPIDPVPSPDGSKVGYVLEQDVYAYDLKADREMRITRGGTPVKMHGLAEFVAQEEMKRMHGYWWSPDGAQMLVEEADHAGVEQWTVGDPARPDKPGLPQYYPRPGKKNVKVRLGLVSLADGIAGKEPKWLEFGGMERRFVEDEKEGKHDGNNAIVIWEYLAGVYWGNGMLPLVLCQDRKQQIQGLYKIDITTGETELLRPQHDSAFLNISPELPLMVPGTDFVIFSRKSVYEIFDGMILLEANSGRFMGAFGPQFDSSSCTFSEMIHLFAAAGPGG